MNSKMDPMGRAIADYWKNKDKAKSMKQMRQIMTKFQERNGATLCKLLKGRSSESPQTSLKGRVATEFDEVNIHGGCGLADCVVR